MNKKNNLKPKADSEVQFGAKLPVYLIKSLKKYAIDRDIQMKDLLKIALEFYLNR